MWDGFCGSLIRRSNRNTLIAALVLLATVALGAVYNLKYLTNFFRGARPVAAAELATTAPSKLTDSFVSTHVGRGMDTGVQHITTDDAHPRGQVDSEYIAVPAGDKVMIVRVDQVISDADPHARQGSVAAATFEGRFVPMPSDLQAQITESLAHYSDLPPVLPVYLDTVDYKTKGYILLVLGILALLLALWLVWRFLQFSGDYARHPFAKGLAHYGQLPMLVQEVDTETAGAHSSYGRMGSGALLTPRWVICRSQCGGVPARFDQVVWAYRHVLKRKMLFITVSKWHSLVVFDSFGAKGQVRLKEQQVIDALREIGERAPQAIIGYDKRLWKLWRGMRKDKSRFLAEAKGLVAPQDLKENSSTMWSG